MTRLFNAPLPVYIPREVLRFPRAWCMNDGQDHGDTSPPTRDDAINLEAHLAGFVGLAQATLLFMLDRLCSPGTLLLILFDDKTIHLHEFLRIIKYSPDMEMRTRLLEILGCQANKYGFEVGEIKALMYIASRKFWIWRGVHELELENERIASWKKLLEVEHLDHGSDKKWGGTKQFLPLLRKTLEFYEKTVVPEGSFDDSDEDLDED